LPAAAASAPAKGLDEASPEALPAVLKATRLGSCRVLFAVAMKRHRHNDIRSENRSIFPAGMPNIESFPPNFKPAQWQGTTGSGFRHAAEAYSFPFFNEKIIL
jgi:hypothetical protein